VPLISDTLERIGGSKHFTTLDTHSGFWQIKISEDSIEKTAFSTPDGHFECLRMAFGLAGAPSTFMRAMSIVLSGLVHVICQVYLDDVLVYTKGDIVDHLEALRTVFERFRKHNLKLKPSKCRLLCSSVVYVGYLISPKGILPCPSKVQAILRYPRPKSPTDIRKFIGFVNFYRRFIQDFAAIAYYLILLTHNDVPFHWGILQVSNFRILRRALTHDPVLRYADFSLLFRLTVDASSVALGAVLSQEEHGVEKPVAFASQQLSETEKRYGATQLECYAVIFGLRQYRSYLLGRPFLLRTDHSALRYLFATKEPTPRLARWIMEASEFTFDIQHVPGKSNIPADTLSRAEYGVWRDIPIKSAVLHIEGESSVQPLIDLDYVPVWSRTRMRAEQRRDIGWKEHIRVLESGGPATPGFFIDEDGILYQSVECVDGLPKLCAPRSMIPEILRRYHDSPMAGHRGREKTVDLIRRDFTWPKLYTEVRDYVRACKVCQVNKLKSPPPVPLQKFQEFTKPMQRIALDIVGPLPITESDNRFILTMQDTFTRYPVAVAIPNATAETIARQFVQCIVCSFGVPESVLCDNGKNFTSKLMERVCELLKVNQVFTSFYHPQGNSHLERSHKSFSDVIKSYVQANHRDWDEWLCFALLAYRNTKHASTQYSPNFLMFGREISMPWDDILQPRRPCYTEDGDYVADLQQRLALAHEHAIEFNRKSAKVSRDRFNSKASSPDISEGDIVLMRNRPAPQLSRKLSPLWSSPHRVVRLRSAVTVDLENLENGKIVQCHISNLVKIEDGATVAVDSGCKVSPSVTITDVDGNTIVTDHAEPIAESNPPQNLTAPVKQPTHHYNLRSRTGLIT
jgi:transposase InsO family protein